MYLFLPLSGHFQTLFILDKVFHTVYCNLYHSSNPSFFPIGYLITATTTLIIFLCDDLIIFDSAA